MNVILVGRPMLADFTVQLQLMLKFTFHNNFSSSSSSSLNIRTLDMVSELNDLFSLCLICCFIWKLSDDASAEGSSC